MKKYYNKSCKCGCNGKIEIQKHHKIYGVPKFISGHNSKGIFNIFKGKKRPDITGKNSPVYKENIKINCKNCKKDFFVKPCFSKKRKFCNHKCFSIFNSGENNSSNRVEVREKNSIRLKKMYKEGTVNPNMGFKKGYKPSINTNIKGKTRKEIIKIYPKWENCGIFGFRPSKAEGLVSKYLIDKKINFISQWRYKLGIADFFIPEYNLIIQCYGDYYHANPEKYKPEDIIIFSKKQKYKAKDIWKKDKQQNDYLFYEEGRNLIILNSENIMKNGINLNWLPF